MDFINILTGLVVGAAGLFGLQKVGGFPTVIPGTKPEQSANYSGVNASDLDVLARTIWGEARGEGAQGMHAVANVIMNRYEKAQSSISYARQFGGTVSQICQKPYQFSVWNSNDPNLSKMMNVTKQDPKFVLALDIAKAALRGTLPDITGGADHYLNIEATRSMRGGDLPEWVDLAKATDKIGTHTFLRLS